MYQYTKLVIAIISLQILGALSGLMTKTNIDSWYSTLKLSSLTPPNAVFGIVWSILYLMMAIAGWLIWQERGNNDLRIKYLFVFQLLVNLSWTPLFFYFHLTAVSFLWIIGLILILITLIVKLIHKNRWAAALLTPYLLWLFLACYLNFYIWINN